MLGDGDGWDGMRHGSTEITHFSHIDTFAISGSLNSLDAHMSPLQPQTAKPKNIYIKSTNKNIT